MRCSEQLAVAMVMCGGCMGEPPLDGNAVTGAVDGVSVSAGSAVLIQRRNPLDETMLVVLSAASCQDQADMYAALDDPGAEVDELVAQWNETFPDEWWKLYMRFTVNSADIAQTGLVVPGHDWRRSSASNAVYGRFMHDKRRLDEGYFDDSGGSLDV
jgi:hypothetical protein